MPRRNLQHGGQKPASQIERRSFFMRDGCGVLGGIVGDFSIRGGLVHVCRSAAPAIERAKATDLFASPRSTQCPTTACRISSPSWPIAPTLEPISQRADRRVYLRAHKGTRRHRPRSTPSARTPDVSSAMPRGETVSVPLPQQRLRSSTARSSSRAPARGDMDMLECEVRKQWTAKMKSGSSFRIFTPGGPIRLPKG